MHVALFAIVLVSLPNCSICLFVISKCFFPGQTHLLFKDAAISIKDIRVMITPKCNDFFSPFLAGKP